MVCRLVQNQKIDLLIHQHTKTEPTLLTTGKVTHGLKNILALEQEGAQPVPCHLRSAILFVEHDKTFCDRIATKVVQL